MLQIVLKRLSKKTRIFSAEFDELVLQEHFRFASGSLIALPSLEVEWNGQIYHFEIVTLLKFADNNKAAEMAGYELDDKGLISEKGRSLTFHTKFHGLYVPHHQLQAQKHKDCWSFKLIDNFQPPISSIRINGVILGHHIAFNEVRFYMFKQKTSDSLSDESTEYLSAFPPFL
jgi:hypothetical protein